MKIGVLTFHRCINYGSYWQAVLLTKGLQALGHDVVILDHCSGAVNIAELKCAYQPVLPTQVPASDVPLYRKKIEKFFSAFESMPLSEKFPLSNPEEMGSYDLVVIGSDEVWNLFHPWYGKKPLFYGDGIPSQLLVSYAASFGNYPATWGLEQEWAEKLLNFDLISVRDENSWWLVKNATGTEPTMVLDPCLQFVEEACSHDSIKQRKYAAVYGHNFSSSFIHEIKSWAKRKGLPLISIGYRNDWCDDQWITAGPHDFPQFIDGAEVVATNFFHGCVFSLRHKKPFVCESSPYRNNKLWGLVNKIGCEKYLVTENASSNDYSILLDNPLDEKTIERIQELRDISQDYLRRVLSLKQAQVA